MLTDAAPPPATPGPLLIGMVALLALAALTVLVVLLVKRRR